MESNHEQVANAAPEGVSSFLKDHQPEIVRAWSFKSPLKYSQDEKAFHQRLPFFREKFFTALLEFFASSPEEKSPQITEILWGNQELTDDQKEDLVVDFLAFLVTLYEFLEKHHLATADVLLKVNQFFSDLGFGELPHRAFPSSLILDSTAECLFGLDDLGKCTYANHSCLELLGFDSVDEIYGKNLHDLIHYKHLDGTHYPEEACPIYHSYIYGEKIHLTNEVFWRNDGTYLFADYRANPIIIGDEVKGAVVSITDVTARKKMEDDLRETQDMLKDYFMHFPFPKALFVGEEFYFKLANKPYEDLIGASVVGKRLKDVLPKDQADKFLQLMSGVYRSGKPYHEKEVHFVAPSTGRLHYVDLVYTPLRNSQGHMVGLMATIIDMTEKVLARQQIAESEARFKAISDKNPQIIWTSSPAGEITYLSNSWIKMTGIPADEVKGTGWQNVLHPEDRERVIKEFRHCLETGTPLEIEFRLYCRFNHSYSWVLDKAQPLTNEQNEITEWLGVMTNVQTLKDSQRALYDQAQFEQHLVGIISHDLRSPLTAIENACDLLVRNYNRNSEEKNHKLLKIIDNSVKRTISLVKDLLDFTRGRLTQFPLIPSTFQITDAIQEIIEELRISYPDRTILVESHPPFKVEWDYPRFQQMIQNLLTNGLKYSPRGSPVQMGLREDASSVEVWVRNFGDPIPPEVQKQIFEPLQRKVSESGNEDKSLGLGLHIVKKLCEAHGGRVSVSSDQEEGTTFTLHLPKKAHYPHLTQ